ncbi:3-oxo-5-alpha-steroid 4-dehydrogenase-domain-containing protein [Mycotypha africana]|uniref:3-oxo-5-alpha-steroid 4-dehydrogenase-domain-containing protein n=1 Tax=Mycotypha africana TaxID=64632 RepID=UPI002301874B|nr:3-oxo-5-alpha-steroid 4-dehydrogenase-domain-containing protein [Mycotypha africana]KAI8970093.1 3-oxo-5-alpha-steroid 4-dehydrogenase-domain-containing protein [Mycotypha africana]
MESIKQFLLKPSTYNTVVGIYATFPVLMIPALFVVNAPYGRFAGKLGIECSLPGKWSWCIMEAVSPIAFGMSIYLTRPTGTPFQIILISAWMAHYINRSIIHPFRATSLAPVHILAFVSSVGFNLINGYTNGMWVGRHSNSIYSISFWFGITLWFTGFVSNIYHDNILFKLRTKKKEKEKNDEKQQGFNDAKERPVKKHYFIPYGGLFEYVSCANYFSEAMEWLGFTLATQMQSTPAIIFTLSTMANLFPRAWRTNAWYKEKFDDYPPERKAVLPFIL